MVLLPFRSLVDQAAGFAGSHRVYANRRIHLITTVANHALLWTLILHNSAKLHASAPSLAIALAVGYTIMMLVSNAGRHAPRFALAAAIALLLPVVIL